MRGASSYPPQRAPRGVTPGVPTLPVRRYRRRPPLVDAIQWDGRNTTDVLAWCGGRLVEHDDGRQVIATNDAMSWAQLGDYLVREAIPGGGWRFYAARKETFEHGYELLPPTA